jgi:acyl-CoA thioesterase-2
MLEVERLDSDLFRAWNPHPPDGQPPTALFGGQVAAHCLRAAAATVTPDHRPHSLHGYFLRPGKDGAWTILHHPHRRRAAGRRGDLQSHRELPP